MTNRRNFIRKLAIGTAGAGLISAGKIQASEVSKPTMENVGIITVTARNEFQNDYKSVLKNLADIGYKCIEGGAPEGVSDSEYKKQLKRYGLRCIALGQGLIKLERELDDILRSAENLEVEYVVSYTTGLFGANKTKMDDALSSAEKINELGRKIHKAGFRFAWHNHDGEFRMIDGRPGFDILLENTDPEFSTVELDWYWVIKAGFDPVEYLKKYPGRFEIGHVKDMNNNTDGGVSCVGQGIIDFAPVFDAAQKNGTKYFIVENERAVKGIECAKVSYKTIQNYLS